ncbi:MAG: ATP-binding protein [Pseudomonadota bacterium]|nr:ATP-binding protein [Pseudomonadota bacterium]
MTIWPRSLFGRLSLLLLTVLAIALMVTILLFRHDRAALLARQFGDTMIVQLQSLRAALAAVDAEDRSDTLRRIGREYNVRIMREEERPAVGGAPPGPMMAELEFRLREALGDGTMLRLQPRLQLLWVRIAAGGAGYWVGFPLPARPHAPDTDTPPRAAIWSATIGACLLLAAFLFARYLAHPLRELNAAVLALGRGDMPHPLPESGPSEIENLNRGFNRMISNLRQLEHDRALLLAGVSHDLRTPLSRLRLGIEISVKDDVAKRGMADDIEEMDRIIGQFLDFARNEQHAPAERQDPRAIVAATVERYRRAGKDVRFEPGEATAIPLRGTAFSRLVTNLIDNALAYGAPPVEIATRAIAGAYVVEVMDRGPGIPATEVERLKQPFTRASAARAHAGGTAGAGLGLAIVERIARLHGGSFAILPREGGGTIAHVELPDGASA